MRRPALIAASLLLAACSAAPPPASETVSTTPAPAASAAAPAEEHTELRDSMQAPIDKAKSVDEVREKSDEEQRKAVEDAGG